MRTKIGIAILLATGILGVVGAVGRTNSAPQAPTAPPAPQPLVVHEWGTFTNFSGSDGIQLDFRPLIENELPPFVYDRSWHGSGPFSKRQRVARQRMETPITYFYSDHPRQLDVRVDFPQGLLTEFYPPAIKMTPRYAGEQEALKDSSLTWKISLQPEADDAAREALPKVSAEDHYGFARETDATLLKAVDSFGIEYVEKFLFYRGLGNFSLPLRLEALPDRRFRVVNDGPDPIAGLFLVMIDEQGLHFCAHASVAAHSTLEAVVPDETAASEELGDRMAHALVAAGLFEKEADAMVHTWQSSWFSEPGARLFYLVPRRLTDEIIPLHIEPAPDQMVRVLVGRMETLTPETAESLLAVVRGMGTCSSPDVEPLRSELDRLGRFADPALAYLRAHADDEGMRATLARLQR
ncbi:MAG TPA: hypothetical protein VHC22_06640 [Pirellulales bacterium]|nr:hypothetical protein [Pirellulales bacterium]